MARPREFDLDVAVAAAMELFWERGYDGVSLNDLSDHLQLNRSSIYAAFGSKHQLFVDALRRYLASQDPSPLEVLSSPGPVLPSIRELLEQYVAATEDPRGCMLVNAAAELLPDDREVAAVVEAAWAELAVALRSALLRAKAQGELRVDADPAAVADVLLVVLQGIRLIGKGSADPRRLQAVGTTLLDLIQI